MAYQLNDFSNFAVSVAMTAQDDVILGKHLHKEARQEDLAFAYWRPSVGQHRFTAVIVQLVLPEAGDRILQGNVAYLPQYIDRVLADIPEGCGVAFMHGHLGPGWQGMSHDDVVAERDRLAGPVAGRTSLPLVGLTRGTDGAWSGRLWLREGPHHYERRWARSVRVVGQSLTITHHPDVPDVSVTEAQVATLSVWGQTAQEQLVRTRVGVVGLGSVGSLVTEALSRIGMRDLTYIDFDRVELRNLDRTTGATLADVGNLKVEVAAANTRRSATAEQLDLRLVPHNVLTSEGLSAALDCDVLICCVDRPWPRHLLNAIAYSHVIPVIDGGIFAKVQANGKPQHVSWSIHTVGPDHACMVCLGAFRLSDVALDREGLMDDPDYVAGLSEEDKAAFSRRNVFPFSMSVAAHEVLQLVGLVTGLPRIGGAGPQRYDGYPGEMCVVRDKVCEGDCEFHALTASAMDLTPNLLVPDARALDDPC